jgi:hypothetical protein
MSGEIFDGEEGAARGDGRHHVPRNRPFVERVRPLRRDCAQRLGERRELHHVAFRRCTAVEQEMANSTGIGAQLCLQLRPIPGNARSHRKALRGSADRRGERAIDLAAMGRQNGAERRPRLERSRHGSSRVQSYECVAGAARLQRRHDRHGPSHYTPTPGPVCNHAEAVAADSVICGSTTPSTAAAVTAASARCPAAQRLHRSMGSQWMRRGGHALAGDGRRAAREVKVAAHARKARARLGI